LEQLQIAKRRENLINDLAVLIVVVQSDSKDFTCARVVNEDAGNFVEVAFVRFDVTLRADETLFFPAEENEADGAFWREVKLREGACGFEDGGTASAIIRRARAEIP